jgi:hypothetical protein
MATITLTGTKNADGSVTISDTTDFPATTIIASDTKLRSEEHTSELQSL